MLHATSLLLALASTLAPASEDGVAWIGKAESRLYRWQKPGSIVQFDIKTDVLDASIAAMERDLAKSPNPDLKCLVDALKHLVVHGQVDTASGSVETELVIDCKPRDPAAKASVEKMKRALGDFVRFALDGLPFKDPALVSRNSAVIGAEIKGDSVLVTLAGRKPGEETTLWIDRRRTLPTYMQTPSGRLDYVYTEVSSGRFAPARLDVQPTSGETRAAEYTYQTLGNLVFPHTIRLSQGEQSSWISFESAKIEARGR